MKKPILLAPLLILLLAGCAWLAPDYKRPALDLPEKWTDQKPSAGTTEILKGWWKEYHDPALQKLVEEALANNGDLAVAAARVQQAQAQYKYAFANQFPLVTAEGIATRSKLGFPNNFLLTNKPVNLSFIGGMLSYEVDLWGKLASMSKAAKAALQATGYNRDAAKLSIASTAAQLYFTILALDADIRITQDTIRSREESYQLVKQQYDRENTNGLVLRQSEAEMEATRARLPKLLEEKDKAESSLSVLLGRSPRDIIDGRISRGAGLEALPIPPVTPVKLPSTLLQRRPDIAAAEEALVASNFNIGVARAAYFPTISLSNLLGISNVDIQNLYSGTMRGWLMGATLAGPVLDFGRTRSGVDLAFAKKEELLASYKNAVRSAFKDVKDALSEQTNSQNEEQAQAKEEKAVKEALRLANLRFSSGYSSYIEVLDAERNLYSAQIGLIAAKLKRLNASVNLCKALGGGWKADTGS